MHVLGHIGFSLGIILVIQRKRVISSHKATTTVLAASLAPDILDKGISVLLLGYPGHGVFHSLLFYFISLPLSFFYLRKAFLPLGIMFWTSLLDVANSDLGIFLYPFLGWSSKSLKMPFHLTPIVPFLNKFRHSFGAKMTTEHYFLFEALGLLLLVAYFAKSELLYKGKRL